MRHFVCLLCIGILAAAPATMEAPRYNPDDLKTLEYIAAGYEANARRQQPIRVRGRIFFEQSAMEGRQPAPGELISARWLNFDYTQKGTKRRYVQDMLHEVGRKQFYALDNDRQIMIHADNVFRMMPLTDEEREWSDAMDEQAVFTSLSTARGDENVARGLRKLVKRITTEDFLSRYDGRLSVQLNDEGVFTIHVTTRGDDTTYKIDSRKGFNLVELMEVESRKVIRRTSLNNVYTQGAAGQWVLSKGEFSYSESRGGVLQTKKFEASEIQVGGFDCPDSLFEKESLNMPADITVEDHHFSPPLIIRRGQGQPTRDNLDKLLEAPIKSMDTAEVSKSGEVRTKAHDAYVQHQGTGVAAAAPVRQDKWNWWKNALLGLAILAVVGAGLVIAWRRRAVR